MPNNFDLQFLFKKVNASDKLQWRLQRLIERPGFTAPGRPLAIAYLQACAVLVLLSDDLPLSAEALHFAQQGILLDAVQNAAGTTLAEKLQDKTVRPVFEYYSLIVSGMKRRDHLLTRAM